MVYTRLQKICTRNVADVELLGEGLCELQATGEPETSVEARTRLPAVELTHRARQHHRPSAGSSRRSTDSCC